MFSGALPPVSPVFSRDLRALDVQSKIEPECRGLLQQEWCGFVADEDDDASAGQRRLGKLGAESGCGVAVSIPRLVISERVTRPGDRIGPLILGATDTLAKPLQRFELMHKATFCFACRARARPHGPRRRGDAVRVDHQYTPPR